MKRRQAFAVLLVCMVSGCDVTLGSPETAETIVYTPSGPVKGTIDASTGVLGFRSIPYAENPINNLRYAPPVPRSSWSRLHDGTQYGPSCITSGDLTFARPREAADSDCLTVSVYVPPNTDLTGAQPKPVMIMLHGGGFIMGSSSYDLISPDPHDFVKDADVILVQVQYRLGPSGFLSLPEMMEEHGYAGTLGLLDQQASFRWVQEHIAAFGGDKNRVTVMGESAGAFSICFHMVAPSNKGLFHRVILQSAMCDFKFQTLEESFEQGRLLAETAGCNKPENNQTSNLECLRQTSEEYVQELLPHRRGLLLHTGVRWFPVMDGSFVSDQPMQLMKEGKALDVDVVLGSNADEGTLFILIAYKMIMFPSAWPAMLNALYEPDRVDFFLNAFPTSWSAKHKMATMFDNMFACSVRRLASVLSSTASPNQQIYVYNYALVPTSLQWPFATLGAFHSSELLYLFRRDADMHAPERLVAKQMRHFWGRFTHDADRNGTAMQGLKDGPAWPAYNRDNEQFYVFNVPHDGFENVQPVTSASLKQMLNGTLVPEGAHGESHVHEFCPLFDTLIDTEGFVVAPEEYDEPLYSWFLNIPVIAAITVVVMNIWTLATTALAAFIAWSVLKRKLPKAT